MADLTVDFITSLDGFGAAEGWPGLWGMHSLDYLDWVGQEGAQDHVLLMGATTYRLFTGFIESGEEDMSGLSRTPDVRLELVASRTFDGGMQLLEYAPTVLDGPPGDSESPR